MGLSELIEEIRRFRDERDWARFHNPKNLAMAVAGEAGELLAELQWATPHEAGALDDLQRHRVSDEAADVLIYLLYLADALQIDLVDAARSKVLRNDERFPVGQEAPPWPG